MGLYPRARLPGEGPSSRPACESAVTSDGEFADAGAVSKSAQVHAGSVAHLRELLAADHRYVFTLIHKFGLDRTAGVTTMPVLSDRSDVIVITDEAHRSQYDTLALNMRAALPRAIFLAFTGTPLIAGEERTREVFGDYVSIYDFQQSVEDGATVPLMSVPFEHLGWTALVVNFAEDATLRLTVDYSPCEG